MIFGQLDDNCPVLKVILQGVCVKKIVKIFFFNYSSGVQVHSHIHVENILVSLSEEIT